MNIVKIILSILLLITLIFLLVIPTIWSYNPTLLTNLNYNTNLNLKELKKPHFFISTHNDTINHDDQLLVCTEATKSNLKFNIISHHNKHAKFNRFLKDLPLFSSYNLLYTGNNLVEKSRKKLENEHVWMFIKEDWENKGAYHILKNTNIPIILVKIKKVDNVTKKDSLYKKLFNRKYKIEYLKIDNYKKELDKGSESFIKYIKNSLYQ